jgi:hypothetical protein
MSEKPSAICFVASPIGKAHSPERNHADWLYQGIIKPVLDQYADFTLLRADKITAPGLIDAQVINHLHDDNLVILDMSFQNANVFYEMGIRHMKRLSTIHMYREDQDIPFDVKPYRAIAFNYQHPDDLTKAQTELKAAIDEVLKPGFVVENPVTRARGIEQLQEGATEPEQLLLREFAQMTDRLRRVEHSLNVLRHRQGRLAEQRYRKDKELKDCLYSASRLGERQRGREYAHEAFTRAVHAAACLPTNI